MVTKQSVRTYFSLLFFSMLMQNILMLYGLRNKLFIELSWCLLIPIILLSWKLVSLSINKKGNADEIKAHICPLLVIIGFCSLFLLAIHFGNHACYGCRIQKWPITLLPFTTTLATLSWFGFIGIVIRNQPKWILFAILNVITTWSFLYNIAGFLWIRNILRW